MGYIKTELQPKDRLPASLINAMQDAIIENELKSAKIATGSYEGTGAYGYDSRMILTFDFQPKVVIIHGTYKSNENVTGTPTILIYDIPTHGSYNNGYGIGPITWGNNSVSFAGKTAALQCNSAEWVYRYIAIG